MLRRCTAGAASAKSAGLRHPVRFRWHSVSPKIWGSDPVRRIGHHTAPASAFHDKSRRQCQVCQYARLIGYCLMQLRREDLLVLMSLREISMRSVVVGPSRKRRRTFIEGRHARGVHQPNQQPTWIHSSARSGRCNATTIAMTTRAESIRHCTWSARSALSWRTCCCCVIPRLQVWSDGWWEW